MPFLLNILSLLLMLTSCSSSGNEAKTANPVVKGDSMETVKVVSPQADRTISNKTFGKLTIGMPVTSLQQLYPDMKTEERPVYEYGVDGETMGILLKNQAQPYLYLWTMKGDSKIHGITALSPDLQTPNGLKVGSTVAEILTLYPNCEAGISYIDDTEFIYIEDLGLRFEFLTDPDSRIGEYDFNDDPQPEFLKFKSKTAKVDRISVP
jgi:hypothetical protein